MVNKVVGVIINQVARDETRVRRECDIFSTINKERRKKYGARNEWDHGIRDHSGLVSWVVVVGAVNDLYDWAP